jgi:hypothetical protein
MDQLYDLLDAAAEKRRFSRDQKAAAVALFDPICDILDTRQSPPGFLLASRERARGATGRIALNAYLLVLGRLARGKDYDRDDQRMEYWKTHLGYSIVQSNFLGYSEKGEYCCATCTLSMLPLYCVGAFERWDNALLKHNVVSALNEGRKPFNVTYSRRYADWVMKFV